jgi:hypothetical protein
MDVWKEPLRQLGQILLFASAVLTLWSMVIYLQVALPSLLRREAEP